MWKQLKGESQKWSSDQSALRLIIIRIRPSSIYPTVLLVSCDSFQTISVNRNNLKTRATFTFTFDTMIGKIILEEAFVSFFLLIQRTPELTIAHRTYQNGPK
jgi:hypothetical protein